MASVPRQTINAIHSVAFMLEEMEESQINVTLRNALDSQMTEFTLDIKMLIEDAREKIDEYIKATED